MTTKNEEITLTRTKKRSTLPDGNVDLISMHFLAQPGSSSVKA